MGPAPRTSTRSPVATTPRRIACQATAAGSTRAAATSETLSGTGTTRYAGTVTEVSDDHDVVVECTGAPDMVEQALAALRQGGRVVLVGDAGQATISPRMWLAKEATLIAAAGYTRAEIVQTLQLIADRGIEPEKLHTRTVGIGSLADGLADLTAADTDDIKIVLDPRIKENS